MSVYFDPRKAQKPVEEMTEEEKNLEMGKQAVSYKHLTLPTKA